MTLDALHELAAYLGGIPGRKNLIWFSGSFPVNLDPDVTLSNEFSPERSYAEQLKATSDLLTANRVAGIHNRQAGNRVHGLSLGRDVRISSLPHRVG
jgi:hypothetical protein